MTKVAIITVNYNGSKDTLDFLQSLKKLETKNLETKTIVVDNGSSDDSVKQILKAYPQVDLLQTGVNKGFAGGYNQGLEYALAWGADYFLIINNDALIKSDNLLTELIKTAKSEEKIGLISPKILFAPGYEFQTDRYQTEEKGTVIWYGGGEFDWNNLYSKHRGIDEVDTGQYDKVEEANFVSGCCLLIKREVLEKVGMFDQKLFAYFEDNDFTTRVDQAGFKKFYNGLVSIYHRVSQTSGVGSPISDYLLTRNRLYFGFRYTNFRTRFALIREAIRFLIIGRSAQKKGVMDFLQGVTGGPKETTKPLENPPYQIKLSVLIVNYNTADLTEKLLESIYTPNSGINSQSTEAILLDNGTLSSTKNIAKKFPKLRYIQNQENEGFTKGYNRAIKFSRGEYVLMLNSDIEVLENGLLEMVKWAQHFKDQAVLGGRLFFPDLSDQDSVFRLPTVWGAIKEYFFQIKGAYFMYLPKVEEPLKVEGLVMAVYLIPRKILNKVGLLDEGTFIFFEDIEYCRRLKKYNVPIYFIPSAKFIHHHGASTKKINDAYEKLKKGSVHYHGKVYYGLLYLVLWVGQKYQKLTNNVPNFDR